MYQDDKKEPPFYFAPAKDDRYRVRAASVTMLRQSRRLLWRSRSLIYPALAGILVCSLLLSASSGRGYHAIPWTVDMSGTPLGADSSGGLMRTKGNAKPTSKDYNDNLARWLFSKEWNETGL